MHLESSSYRASAVRIFHRSLLVAIPIASVVGLTAGAYAAVQRFAAGEPVSAAKLNGNFDDVQKRLDALEAGIANGRLVGTVDRKPYSVGATRVVGVTPATYDGQQFGGYRGAKQKCEATYGATAHMCTSEEFARSAQAGTPLPAVNGWYALATRASTSIGSNTLDDCGFWSSAAAAAYGPVGYAATASNGGFSNGSCATPTAIMCCDQCGARTIFRRAPARHDAAVSKKMDIL